MSKYNPAIQQANGKPFNYEPPQRITNVTDKQRAKAQQQNQKVIESLRKKLGN
jgi:hypothetical protein